MTKNVFYCQAMHKYDPNPYLQHYLLSLFTIVSSLCIYLKITPDLSVTVVKKKHLLSQIRLLCLCLLWQVSDLRLNIEGLEKERDFYFGKLRDIEVLCQEHENDNAPIVKQIMDILYATEVSY